MDTIEQLYEFRVGNFHNYSNRKYFKGKDRYLVKENNLNQTNKLTHKTAVWQDSLPGVTSDWLVGFLRA